MSSKVHVKIRPDLEGQIKTFSKRDKFLFEFLNLDSKKKKKWENWAEPISKSRQKIFLSFSAVKSSPFDKIMKIYDFKIIPKEQTTK